MQLLSVMNSMWLDNSMNMRMKLYKIQPTGSFEGFIELVEDSITIAKITDSYGGATSAFSKQPISYFM
jgi:phosphatidylinositol kinase/protein kinase (PI-3  family)